MKATNIEFKGLKREGLSIKKSYIILPSCSSNVSKDFKNVWIDVEYSEAFSKADLFALCFLNNLSFDVSEEYITICLPIESITSFGVN